MTRWSALLVASTLALMPAAARAQDAVKIGILNDQSGNYAEFGGLGSVEAAKLAIEDFGGTVLGKPIEIVTGDHQNKPDIAVGLARLWYDVDGVTAIADLEAGVVAIHRYGECHRGVGVLHGVVEQVVQGASQENLVR